MCDMSKRKYIPEYFRAKYQLIVTVTFTALFSLVFMLVSIPFSHNAWFALGTSQAFTYTASFFLISLLFVILSKQVMYYTRNSFEMTFFQYVMWNLAEVIIICLVYTAFSIKGNELGVISLERDSFAAIFFNAFVYCFVSLIIPYIIAGMVFAIIDKNKTIRLMNYSNVVSDIPVPENKVQQVTLFDNNGVLKMSVSLASLYYIESEDNYIRVWYIDSKGGLTHYMLRCRLKTVEESFKGSSLVRCNRKYIVNMDKVKVLRKEIEGYELDLDNDYIPAIPVTKTYVDNVLARFNRK